jgi:hypothetical protein
MYSNTMSGNNLFSYIDKLENNQPLHVEERTPLFKSCYHLILSLKSPLYTKGLASRLIILLLPGIDELERRRLTDAKFINRLLDVINDCAKGLAKNKLKPTEFCKVSINCNYLLASILSSRKKSLSRNLIKPMGIVFRMCERPQHFKNMQINVQINGISPTSNTPIQADASNLGYLCKNQSINHSSFNTMHVHGKQNPTKCQQTVLNKKSIRPSLVGNRVEINTKQQQGVAETVYNSLGLSYDVREERYRIKKTQSMEGGAGKKGGKSIHSMDSKHLGYRRPKWWYPSNVFKRMEKGEHKKDGSPNPPQSKRGHSEGENIVESILPIKFLVHLKRSGIVGEIDMQRIKNRAYLLLSSWLQTFRVRSLGIAFMAWYEKLQIYRRVEYRYGIACRNLATITKKASYLRIKKRLRVWIRSTTADREIERDEAARYIQRCYRGMTGRRSFARHLRRHLSSIPIQTLWRKYENVCAYQRARFILIGLQGRVRGHMQRLYLHYLHSCATLIQSFARMHPVRSQYMVLETSVCLLQTSYRAWIARKLFYKMIEKQLRLSGIELTAAIALQKHWRAFVGRKVVRSIIGVTILREASALKIQKWWYELNGQFSTFLLMRLLAFQESLEIKDRNLKKKSKRFKALIVMQAAIQRYIRKKKLRRKTQIAFHAAKIQKKWRGVSTRRWFIVFKQNNKSARVIQRRIRKLIQQKVLATSFVKKTLCFGIGASTSDAKPIHTKVLQVRLHEQRMELYSRWKFVNIQIIQSFSRKWKSRLSASHHFSAIKIQALIRRFVVERYFYNIQNQLKKVVYESEVVSICDQAIKRAMDTIKTVRNTSAAKIQAIYRGIKERAQYKVLLEVHKGRKKAAVTLRGFFLSRRARARWLFMVEQNASIKDNVFRNIGDSIHIMIKSILKASDKYFSLNTSLKGMGIATILLRLGLGCLADVTKIALAKQAQRSKVSLTQATEWVLLNQLLKEREQMQYLRVQYNEVYLEIFSMRGNRGKESAQEAEDMAETATQKLHDLANNRKSTLQKFELICDAATLKSLARTIYQRHFRVGEKQAHSFANAISTGTSYFQLQQFISDFLPNESRLCKKEIHTLGVSRFGRGWSSSGYGVGKKYGFKEEDLKWDTIRIRKCFEIYQMGMERILRIASSCNFDWAPTVADALKTAQGVWHWRAPKTSNPNFYKCGNKVPDKNIMKESLRQLCEGFNGVAHYNNACFLIQNVFRRHSIARLARERRSFIFVILTNKMYLQERREIHSGVRVRRVALADRILERIERREQGQRAHRALITNGLNKVLRAGYYEHIDLSTGIVHYINDYICADILVRPVYDYTEYLAAKKLQLLIRNFLFKTKNAKLQKSKEENRKKKIEKNSWEYNKSARARYISFVIQVSPEDHVWNAENKRRKIVEYDIKTNYKRKVCGNSQFWISSLEKKFRGNPSCKVLNSYLKARLSEHMPSNLINKRGKRVDMMFRPVSHLSRGYKEQDPIELECKFDGASAERQVVSTPFGEGEVNFPSTSTLKHRMDTSMRGISKVCWVYEAVKRRNKTPIAKKTLDEGETAVYDGKSSFEKFCERRLEKLPLSLLRQALGDMRLERSSPERPVSKLRFHKNIRSSKGLISLIFREIQLKMSHITQNRARYRSLTTEGALISAKININLKHGNKVILFLPSKRLCLQTSRQKTVHGVSITAKLTYTHVEIPFGWQAIENDQEKSLYRNIFTNESTFFRPEYNLEQNLAAKTIQNILRTYVQRKKYLLRINLVSVYETAVKTLNTVKSYAWVGYGTEGMTVRMLLLRLGEIQHLRFFETSPQTLEIQELVIMDEGGLKKMGIKDSTFRRYVYTLCQAIKKEENSWGVPTNNFRPRFIKDLCVRPRESSRKLYTRKFYTSFVNSVPKLSKLKGTGTNYPEKLPDGVMVKNGYKIDVLSDFMFISNSLLVQQIIKRYQQFSVKQTDNICTKIMQSQTPVSLGMLKSHLLKYKGKPKLCSNNILEICNGATCNTLQEEQTTYKFLRVAVRRLLGKIITLKIYTLASKLSKIAKGADEIANQSVDKANVTRVENIFLANDIILETLPWHKTYKRMNYFWSSLILRIGLQWIVCYQNASCKIQSIYRKRRFLWRGRRQRKTVYRRVSKLQALWRGILGRRRSFALRAQLFSSWEQLYDEERSMYYFFDNITHTARWNAPCVPFKPFVWWSPPDEDVLAAEGFCASCITERSSRTCDVCVDKTTGLPVEFCFACFALAHKRSQEFHAHTCTVMAFTGKVILLCIECNAPACVKCIDCEDSYCKACFRRMHRKGKRRTHVSYSFTINSNGCIECKHEIATCKCLNCDDYFCDICFKKIHSFGKRTGHIASPLESITKSPLFSHQGKQKQEVGIDNLPEADKMVRAKKKLKSHKNFRTLRPSCPPPSAHKKL